jgi:hypothetical protein
MSSHALIAGFALTVEPDPRDAAAECLVAATMILARLQVTNPTVGGDAMLDNMFGAMRESFHNAVRTLKELA